MFFKYAPRTHLDEEKTIKFVNSLVEAFSLTIAEVIYIHAHMFAEVRSIDLFKSGL